MLSSSQILSEDGKKASKGYDRHWDKCTRTPFLYHKVDKIMITYEECDLLASAPLATLINLIAPNPSI
jgi:GH18 family chitinase